VLYARAFPHRLDILSDFEKLCKQQRPKSLKIKSLTWLQARSGRKICRGKN
jgi:hypothetical protein